MSHSQFHCTGRVYLDLHGLIFETSICYWQDQPGSPTSLPSALGAAAWERVRVRCVGRGCRPQPSPAASHQPPAAPSPEGREEEAEAEAEGRGAVPAEAGLRACVAGVRLAGRPPHRRHHRGKGLGTLEKRRVISPEARRASWVRPRRPSSTTLERERGRRQGDTLIPATGSVVGPLGQTVRLGLATGATATYRGGARMEESRGCPSRPALGRWLDGPAGAGGSSCPNTGDEPAGRGPPMAGLTGLSTGLSEAPEHSLTCCGLRF
ncbi:hypothetical protein D5F01_LYC25313 [Larimichthys crocea]|uniref:Uncharacterized protein n=1 Tax=Larimichthys crocea TaxID=215358 RepID=A0A6G0HD93_LARCR|nr:hypothetical protein D5F01_LYC25313 [Larimichthys crocea]